MAPLFAALRPLSRHQRRRRTALGAVSAAVLLLLSGGCHHLAPTIEVPISNWPGYEYFYLARRLGLDRPHGLVIEPVQYPDPQTIVHAYLRGSISVAQLTTVEAVDICARTPKRCPVVVLILDESRGGDQIAARKTIHSLDQLRGRTVGVTFSTLGPYVLSRALQQRNLTLSDVRLKNIPLSQMPQALRSGDIDAAVFFPPFSDYAARDGVSKTIFDSRAIPGEIFDVLVVDPEFLGRNQGLIRGLIQAWSDAHRHARRSPQRAIALMAQREQLSAQEFQKSEQGLIYYTLEQQRVLLQPGGSLARHLKAVQAVQQRLGLTRSGAATPVVSASFLEAP